MNKILKVNRKHFIDPSQIEKIVIDGDNARIHLKNSYPAIVKTTEGLCLFKKRLVNIGFTIYDFKLEGDRI